MTILEKMKQKSQEDMEKKMEAIRNGSNQVALTNLRGEEVTLYYHSLQWHTTKSPMASYK